jgi:hypothetical protein
MIKKWNVNRGVKTDFAISTPQTVKEKNKYLTASLGSSWSHNSG